MCTRSVLKYVDRPLGPGGEWPQRKQQQFKKAGEEEEEEEGVIGPGWTAAGCVVIRLEMKLDDNALQQAQAGHLVKPVPSAACSLPDMVKNDVSSPTGC